MELVAAGIPQGVKERLNTLSVIQGDPLIHINRTDNGTGEF